MLGKQVQEKLQENNLEWGDFSDWIFGQTVQVTPSGELNYFDSDVERFIELKTKGTPTYFD